MQACRWDNFINPSIEFRQPLLTEVVLSYLTVSPAQSKQGVRLNKTAIPLTPTGIVYQLFSSVLSRFIQEWGQKYFEWV